MSQPEGDPVYLLLIGRQAICYTTSVEIAKDVAEIYVHFQQVWQGLSTKANFGVVPFLTKLDGVVVIPGSFEWVEGLNGWSCEIGKNPVSAVTLRIEQLNWGIKDPQPVPKKLA
jgi:hypothetical protein